MLVPSLHSECREELRGKRSAGGKDEDTSKETYQVQTMECGDTSNRNQAVTVSTKNDVQQGGSTVGVALSCTFYDDFLVKGTALVKKKPILGYACLK